MRKGSVSVKKIEFCNIDKGLYNIRNNTEPAKLQKSSSVATHNYITQTVQQSPEKKFSTLTVPSTSPTFYFSEGKIPQIPVTLMNSTMKNKLIQIKILLKQRKTAQTYRRKMAQKPFPLSLSRAQYEQESAVKEILDEYPKQLDYRSVTEQRKRKEAMQIKERYTNELFIKNQMPKSLTPKTFLPIHKLSTLETESNTQSYNKSPSFTISTQGKTYCQFLTQLRAKYHSRRMTHQLEQDVQMENEC